MSVGVSPLGHALAPTTSTSVEQALKLDNGLWVIPIPMPTKALPYSLCVVAERPDATLTVVDPGWDSPDALDALEGFLRTNGRAVSDITHVIATHDHIDHAGLAEQIRRQSGALVAHHADKQQDGGPASWVVPADETAVQGWGVDAAAHALLVKQIVRSPRRRQHVTADVLLQDGDRTPGSENWTVMHTPGHTAGHICLIDETRRIVFTGDHVLPMMFPGLGLSEGFTDNPVKQYLHSLDRLAPYASFHVVPGHGYPFADLGARIAATRRHVLRRAHEVEGALGDSGRFSTFDLAGRLTWKGGWAALSTSPSLLSALRQTDLYRRFVTSGGLEEYRTNTAERESNSPGGP